MQNNLKKMLLALAFVFVVISFYWYQNQPSNRNEVECKQEKLEYLQQREDVPYDFFEFCIPNNHQYLEDIKKINQEINCIQGSGGRIGCNLENELLCMGNPTIDNLENKLCELSILNYVKKISGSNYE